MLRNTGGEDLHMHGGIHTVMKALEFSHLVFCQVSYYFLQHHDPTTVAIQSERSVPIIDLLSLKIPNDV